MEKIEQKIEEIKSTIKEENIQNIYLNFVDFSGEIYTKMVGAKELIRNTHVSWFDGISLNGKLIRDFKEEESDWLVLLPDPFSFRTIPFLKEEQQKGATIFCNIKNNPLDTRKLLSNAVNEFLDLEITPMMGTELIYKIDNSEEKQDFYKNFATNTNTIFNNNVVDNLLKSNIDIEYYMSYGKKHQRIDLVPDMSTYAADKLFTARWFVENLGIKGNKIINFENVEEDYISACPLHMSLWNKDRTKNLFFDENKDNELSQLGEKFIKGILFFEESIKAFSKVCTKNPVKEYKNTVSEARDGSIIEVPMYFKEKQKKDRIGWSKRCIYNGLNADTNYYLMFSALLYAGLYGIKNTNLEIKESEEELTTNEKMIKELQKNTYFAEKLGNRIIEKTIKKLGGNKNE